MKNNIEVKVYLLERKRATTRTVRIVTDQKNLPKEEALGRWGQPCRAVLLQKCVNMSIVLIAESLDDCTMGGWVCSWYFPHLVTNGAV